MKEAFTGLLLGLVCLAALTVVTAIEDLPATERIAAFGAVAQAAFAGITAYFAYVGLTLWRKQINYERQAKVAVALLDQAYVCGHATERIREPSLHVDARRGEGYASALRMVEDMAAEISKLRACSISFRAITGNDQTSGDVQIIITAFDQLRTALTALLAASQSDGTDPDYAKHRAIAVAVRHDAFSSRIQGTMERLRETVQPFL